MNKREFLEHGVLYADTVQEAFEKYKFCILSGTDEQMLEFIATCFRKNQENAYADFYYANLTEEQKENFLSGLDKKDRELVLQYVKEPGDIYFRLEEELLQFLSKITIKEWLFSTFYFNGQEEKGILWGNYGLRFPIFCENERILSIYKERARECGLDIEEEGDKYDRI